MLPTPSIATVRIAMLRDAHFSGIKTTDQFSHLPDYTEAFNNAFKGEVYFGSIRHTNTLRDYRSDVLTNGIHSVYYAKILCPERRTVDGASWSYYKNKAFLAGIIDSQRSVKLLTDIDVYKRVGTGTIDEMLWLLDNGYTASPDTVNPEHTILFQLREESSWTIRMGRPMPQLAG